MGTPYTVVLVTVPNEKSATKLGRILVQSGLAACVNRLSGVSSIYRWRGKIEQASECMLVIKTKRALMGRLTEAIRKNHPYTVPEIIALPIASGHTAYLDWIKANTG